MRIDDQGGPLIDEIADWLVDQSLRSPKIADMFEGVCNRVYGLGVPLARAMVSYETLHPLFDSEAVVWKRNEGVKFEQYTYGPNIEAWNSSPLKYMIDTGTTLMRRRLIGPNTLLDFDVLEEFRDLGLTDYLASMTAFDIPTGGESINDAGIIVSWASDRESGFSADDLNTLTRIQRRFAVACKTVIQASIANNLTETYLGRRPGELVLSGRIRRGDGEKIRAVVWYSDIRGSTLLADRMPMSDYLELLNDYFECAAGAALDAGGEVLDFIGDGVLAIFPISDQLEVPAAAKAAAEAVGDAVARLDTVNDKRRHNNGSTIEFGIGLSLGEVMFGNIGVPERLTFSVIGPTVNQVARIEKLTRNLKVRALATDAVASATPSYWQDAGTHALEGVVDPVALHSWRLPN